jgi:hypothetical protein
LTFGTSACFSQWPASYCSSPCNWLQPTTEKQP